MTSIQTATFKQHKSKIMAIDVGPVFEELSSCIAIDHMRSNTPNSVRGYVGDMVGAFSMFRSRLMDSHGISTLPMKNLISIIEKPHIMKMIIEELST